MRFGHKALAAWVLALGLIMGLGERPVCGGVAVSPLKQEISLKPGEETKVALTLAYNVREATDKSQKMSLALMDVLATEEGTLMFKEAGALKNSACKWVKLDGDEAALDPGESRSVVCRIAVPESAAPGEYYAAVMVTLATPGRTEAGVQVQYRIASGLFVTVLGRTFPREARIARCELNWPQAPATNPATGPATRPADARVEMLPNVQVLLENTGRARFDGSGKLTVLDDQRRVLLVSPMTTQRACVFGGDSRLFDAAITKALPAGKYTLRVEMDYQSSWAKARRDLAVEITPEQAAELAQAKARQAAGKPLVEATPDKLSAVVPPGASRHLAVTLKNTADGEVSCTAVLAGGDRPGLTVTPDQFTIARGGKKTLAVQVESVAGAPADPISAIINVVTSQEGGSHSELSIPVEIQPKMER